MPAVASIFAHSAPLVVEAGRVVVALEDGSFLAEQGGKDEARGLLARAASEHFGVETTFDIDVGGRHRDVQTVAAKNTAEHAARVEQAKQRVAEHPLVVAAVTMLEAELRDIRLPPELS